MIKIRLSNEMQRVLALRHGVTQGHISRIQAGLVWRDVVDSGSATDENAPALLGLPAGLDARRDGPLIMRKVAAKGRCGLSERAAR